MQYTAQAQRPKRGARIIAEIVQALTKNMKSPLLHHLSAYRNIKHQKRAKQSAKQALLYHRGCLYTGNCLFSLHGTHFAPLQGRLLWRTIPPGFIESIQGLLTGLYSSGGHKCLRLCN
jgi:hypothetical protein